MTLLVSIHDVTPALEAGVKRLWELCASRGIAPALLVVPNWHGEWPLEEHSAFVDWIRARAAEGAEIILHGERHDEVGLPRTAADSWRAMGRTAREGEFLTLERDAARVRIDRGLALFERLSLQPVGFVPPAWLAREGCHEAVGDAGLNVSEDEDGVRVHARGSRATPRAGARRAAPALRWSGRTPTRAWGSVFTASARWHLQRRAPLVRIAFHPQDLDHPATARSLAASLDRWLAEHEVTRYAALGERA